MKIGVIVDSFKLPLREGILKAKEIGAEGIQLYAVSGEMSPDNLKGSARLELKNFIKSNGLEVSALCGDFGGHGFTIQEANSQRIENSKKILELALELGTNIVTTHIGVIPENSTNPRYEVMQLACRELGEAAAGLGGYFAIETGPEKATTLNSFLNSLHTKGMSVNFDPANLVMVTADDPVKGVATLGDYIVHTHAKDGSLIKQTDPEIIYNYFAEGGIDDLHLEDYFIETPLGLGGVDFVNYIRALHKINYNGFLTIEREVGNNPEKDIKEAVSFLKTILTNR